MPTLYTMSHMAFNNGASTCLHSFSSIDLQEVYDWVGQETSQQKSPPIRKTVPDNQGK